MFKIATTDEQLLFEAERDAWGDAVDPELYRDQPVYRKRVDELRRHFVDCAIGSGHAHELNEWDWYDPAIYGGVCHCHVAAPLYCYEVTFAVLGGQKKRQFVAFNAQQLADQVVTYGLRNKAQATYTQKLFRVSKSVYETEV